MCINDDFGQSHHPAQHGVLVLHGVLAMPMLWLIGVIWTAHIKRGWRQRSNRLTGSVLGALLLIETISAAALYYLANEQWRAAASAAHWVLGLLLPIGLIFHIWLGRRRLRAAPRI